MLNPPPVQGSDLSQSQAQCALKKIAHLSKKIPWSPFLLALSGLQNNIFGRCVIAATLSMTKEHIALVLKLPFVRDTQARRSGRHTQSFALETGWMKNEPLSPWLVESKHTPLHPLDWCQSNISGWAKSDTFRFQMAENPCWPHCKAGVQGLGVSRNPEVHSCTENSSYPNQLGKTALEIISKVLNSSRDGNPLPLPPLLRSALSTTCCALTFFWPPTSILTVSSN